jgi:hypothetical protein
MLLSLFTYNDMSNCKGHVLLSDTYSAFYFVVQLLLILNITESP